MANPVKALLFQLAENMGCSAAEAGQRVSMAELRDWLGFYRYREARRDQAREQARIEREADKRGKSGY